MSATKRNWAAGFYWIGVAMAVGCIALVVVAHTAPGWWVENTPIPLLWVFASIATAALVAAELCYHASLEEGSSKPSPQVTASEETDMTSDVSESSSREPAAPPLATPAS